MHNEDITARALNIIKECREILCRLYPMFITPVCYHKPEASDKTASIASDYETLYFNPVYVCACHEENKYALCAVIMHTVLHCLFYHQTQAQADADKQMCADLAVEAMLENSCADLLKSAKIKPFINPDYEISYTYKNLVEICETRAPHYSALKKAHEKRLVCRDDHTLWDLNKNRRSVFAQTELAEVWKQMLYKILSEAEQNGSSKLLYGMECGMTVERISPSKENGISYEALIKQYLKTCETSRQNPEELDLPSYMLGFELYENVPLIEYSEVRENERHGSIIIALDTSGSCEGEIANRFLRETINVINSLSRSRCKIRILQCDTRIQNEYVIGEDEPPDMTKLSGFRGFGGTDFRPVFKRAEELSRGEELDLLIYFTDACGIYPPKKPSVPSILIIPESQIYYGAAPDWADTYVLKKDRFIKYKPPKTRSGFAV